MRHSQKLVAACLEEHMSADWHGSTGPIARINQSGGNAAEPTSSGILEAIPFQPRMIDVAQFRALSKHMETKPRAGVQHVLEQSHRSLLACLGKIMFC